jgi:hypothetical protein
MAYIGRDTDKISNVEVLDNITFDGSSSYTLQKSGVNFTPSSANNILISIDGVVQAGNFTVSGSTIDFGTAVAGTSTCDFVLHYGVGLITAPSDGTVTEAKIGTGAVTSTKLADSSVTTAKLNDASVSLAKLTATGTKDATTFLRGDNTFAEAGGGGKILQVQFTNSTNFISTTSQSFQTLVSVNITPSATSSTILLMGSVGEPDQIDGRLIAYFHRDSTSLGFNNGGGRIVSEFGRGLTDTGSEQHFGTISQMMVDNPGTTSQITYSIKIHSQLGSTVRVGNGGSSNIIAMEIGV